MRLIFHAVFLTNYKRSKVLWITNQRKQQIKGALFLIDLVTVFFSGFYQKGVQMEPTEGRRWSWSDWWETNPLGAEQSEWRIDQRTERQAYGTEWRLRSRKTKTLHIAKYDYKSGISRPTVILTNGIFHRHSIFLGMDCRALLLYVVYVHIGSRTWHAWAIFRISCEGQAGTGWRDGAPPPPLLV